MVANSSKEQCIRVTQPIKFKVLQSLCDIKAWHYGLTCNMNFMVLGLLVTSMSLWIHHLDMVVKNCSLDLIGTLCGKIVWSFPLLGTWTSLHEEVKLHSTFHWFFWTFVCLPIVLWISKRFVVCFNCVVHFGYEQIGNVQLSWRWTSTL